MDLNQQAPRTSSEVKLFATRFIFAALGLFSFLPTGMAAALDRHSPLIAPLETRTPPPSKSRLLGELKETRNKQIQDIENIDQSIRKLIQETQSVSFRGSDVIATEKHMTSLPTRLTNLQEMRTELLLRRDFLDQLIFQVDSKWLPQNSFARFLEDQLLDMAANELTSNVETQTKSELWRFAIYLSIAIREVAESRENLVAFLSEYMAFSSVRSPKSPLAFLESRNYTNGAMSQVAHPIKRDQIGAGVEKRLRERGVLQPAQSSPISPSTPVLSDTQSASTTQAPPTDRAVEIRTRLSSKKDADTKKSIDRGDRLDQRKDQQ